MNPVAPIPNLTDFTGAQRDCFHLLLGTPALRGVNIIEERRFLLQSDVENAALWQTPRNGTAGAGVICEMVTANVEHPNVSGPIFDLEFGFAVLEERHLNLTPGTGTMLTAEQIAQLILDTLHLTTLDSVGTLYATGIAPAADWIDPESGIIAQRARLAAKNSRSQTKRCAPVRITVADGECTLACATPDAEIWFTLTEPNDLAPPTPAPSNREAGAALYLDPFPVAAGQIIRAGAVHEILNPSPITRTVIPS